MRRDGATTTADRLTEDMHLWHSKRHGRFASPAGAGYDLEGDDLSRAVPVLIVSAYSGSDLQARSRAIGAAGFISKPFDGRELVGTVDRILDEAHRVRQAR